MEYHRSRGRPVSFQRFFFRLDATFRLRRTWFPLESNILGTAGKNLLHLRDRPIVEIQDANRSLLWARLSQLWHQTSAVCAGYYCLRRNSADSVLTTVRLSFDSNEFSRRQASLRRVVRNRGSRFDVCHPVCG